jgi:chromosome segregation ATPase
LDDEQTRIEAIDENYDTYHDLQTVETEIEETDADLDDVESFPVNRIERARTLEDQYNEVREELDDARQGFQSMVNVEDSSTYREQLLAHSNSLQTFETELSRWREQVENLRETTENLRDRRNELEQRVSELHPDWGELDDVCSQLVDTLAEGEIRSVTDDGKTTRSEVEELEDEIQQFENRYDDLESRIKAASESTDGVSIKSQLPTAAAGTAAAVVFGGGAAISASALAGVAVTVVVLVATGAYLLSNLEMETPTDDGIAIDTLRARREDVESQLESAQNALETKKTELD